MRKVLKFLPIILLFFIVIGCNKPDKSVESKLYAQLNEKNEKLTKLNEEVSLLKSELNKYVDKDGNRKKGALLIDEYPLLAKQWDSLSICQSNDSPTIVVENKKIMAGFKGILQQAVENNTYNGGNRAIYCYTVVAEGEEVEIYIVEDGIINVGDKFYEVNKNIKQLGNALYNRPLYFKNLTPLTKLALSGYMETSTKETLSSHKITNVVNLITKGTIVKSQSELNKGNKIDVIQFYFFGEVIEVTVYDNVVIINAGENKITMSNVDGKQIIAILNE